MIHKKLLLTFIGILSLSFQANAMKRVPSDDLIDYRLVKKNEPELKEKRNKWEKKKESKQTSMPTPIGLLLRSDEVANQQRMHEESLDHFRNLYAQFYQAFRRADEENGFLSPAYFVALARCKNSIPHNLLKQKRAFNQLALRAEALRAPIAPVAPVAQEVLEVDEENADHLALDHDGMNLNVD